MKRTRTLLVAFVVVGVLATGLLVASGRAASLGSYLPTSVTNIFASSTAVSTAIPIQEIKAPAVKPLAPLAAGDAVPILYYDFENNTTRTTFENLVEQAVNGGSGALTLNTIAGGGGVAGAGTFNGGVTGAGQAITATTWSASTTDPGTAAANYFQFVVNTTGFSGLSVTFDSQASSTGPARVGVLFSNNGSTFTTTSTGVVTSATFTGNSQTFSLGGGADNQSSVTIRIYGFAGSAADRAVAPAHGAFAGTGTYRIDNLTVRANTVTASKTLLNYPAIGLSIQSGTAFTPTYGDFTVNGSGINVSLGSALQESGTFTVSNGTLNCGTNVISGAGTFTLSSGATLGIGSSGGISSSGATGNIQTTTRTFSTGGNYIYNATGVAQVTGTGLPNPLNNLTINNSSGVSLSQLASVNGTLDLVSGIFTSNTNLFMQNGSQITKSDGNLTGNPQGPGTYNVVYSGQLKGTTSELGGTGLTNVTVDMNPSQQLILDQTRTVPGTLALTNGMVNANGFTLIANGAVTRNTGMVVGNLRRFIAAPGSYTFDVGTISNSYSPVVLNVTAGSFSAAFVVSATGTSMPGISGANKLNRYWTLENIGNSVTSANLTFTYPSGDVVGTAANYKFIKKDSGGVLSILNPTGTPTTTSATINGVTQFSDWTLAEANAVQSGSVQFSSATYSDNETNADHTFNAVVTRTGGSDGVAAVNFAVTDGTALVSGNDYVASPAIGFVQWSAGDATPKNITITVKGDLVYEGDETVNFAITAPMGGAGAALGSPNTAVLTIVNDDNPPATLVVTKTADTNSGACLPGDCSLREAINAANSNPVDANVINFNIPNTDPGLSGGVYVITPTSALPAISGDLTTIDGTSQTTFGGNTNAAGPEVEINGAPLTAPPSTFIDGLVLSGGNTTVKGLVVSGFKTPNFTNRGILISSGGNTIQGNYIGTNASGTAALPNGDGIMINNSVANNVIGGTSAGQGNLISGNSLRGLVIIAGSSDTTIRGNLVGTNAAGTGAVANGNAGIEISGSSNQNTIGSLAAGARNVISGNGADGVKLDGTLTSANLVQGNYIGTDVTGTLPLGNAGAGVRFSSGAINNTVGGLAAGTRNVISANGSGVLITGFTGPDHTTSNHVLGNYIGTDVTGMLAIGNQEAGVDISDEAQNNNIGDGSAEGRNVISGNLGSLGTPAGVLIRGANTNGNSVLGNYIGVAADGTSALGNTGGGSAGSQGVFIKSGATANVIGGVSDPGEGNVIANNSGDGIRVYDDVAAAGSTAGNTIRGNAIYGNAKLGINLFKSGEGDGVVTANDALDTDVGPNGLQNFPVITTAVNGSTTVSGTLNSISGEVFDIDIYLNTACDSTHGEGRVFLGTAASSMTNGSGDATFSVTVPALTTGQVLTATATRSNGDTSEFSACYVVTAVAAGETDVSVSGGSLVITDANGGNTNDTLTISLLGANIRINDPNNALTAGAGATQIDANTVEVPLASITGNIQVNTLLGDDTLTLALAGGDFIPAGGVSYDGGGQTSSDKLVITGGAQGTVTYNYTNANDGSIVMSAFGTVNYIDLEPITNSGSATDVIFNLPAGSSHQAFLSGLGGGNSRLASGMATFEQTDFANPTGSVTITAGDLNNFISVNALDANYPSLTINGGQGQDSVNFNGNITFAANKNLDVNLQNDDPTPGIDNVFVNFQVITSGTGTIDVRASEDIFVNSGGRLQTENGSLTVEANLQTPASAGEHYGVTVEGGTIESTGSGNISIKGRGGDGGLDSFDGMYGVLVWNGGKVLSTGTGTITVEGTGGARTGGPVDGESEVFGVYVYLIGSEISSVSGAIQITGQGGATNDTSSLGVVVAGGKIQQSGAGALTVNGTGGVVTGGHPVPVDSGGVFIVPDENADGGVIASAGSGVNAGNIIVNGISGPGGAGAGQGLRVDAPGSVTTVDGSITLAGTGGACGNACLGTSIRGQVEATGTGAIDITGTGAASTGAFPTHGVNVRSGGAVITTSGNITITGTGGNGTDNAGFNVGSSGPGSVQTTGGGTITVNADTIKLATNANATIDAGAASVSLRQKTNTVAIDLGSALDNAANTLELSDGELDRVFAGTVNIGNASSGAITVTAVISRTTATVLSLLSGANIDIAAGSLDSNGGDVTLNPGTNVFPVHFGTDITTGATATLALTSGKDLKIEINGTSVDDDYTQLNVAGLVNLNSANLSFAGSSYTPVGGDSFTIVNNDGADAITGTFANGPTFTNFLGSPYTATISYTGGDGNDAVLTVESPCTPPAIVYVDDSWVGTPLGTDPDGGAGPATNFGCDSFATIQEGVNGVTAGGTVNVASGLYTENVTIPKALTLTGAGAATVTLRPAISDPNCGGAGGGSLCAGSSNLILVQASNVTISGLTLDGDNTSLPGGINVGGANVDARNGIITNHLLGTFNNLEVHHATIRNIYLRGVYASSGGSFDFHDNTVDNVQAEAASIGMFSFSGAGAYTNNTVSNCNDAISANHSRGISFTGNTVTTSASGIHTDNSNDGGGTADTISGNTVTNSQMFGYGIWVFVPYKTVNVLNNTTQNVVVGYAAFGMAPGITAKPIEEGTKAEPGRRAPKTVDVSEPATAARLAMARAAAKAPLAPPAPPYAAIFTGNTADGQHNPSSTGVYFTTSQTVFGSSNIKVKFTSNTVVNNFDGFFLEAEPGFTLETAASFNRIVDNDFSAVTVSGQAGTLNGSMENNWWGCNAGPNNTGCGDIINGASVDHDPWIVLGISASPATIPPGGSTTVTADMTHNSNAAVPSVTDFVPQVAVTFGAVNGTVFPTSGTITNGQATTTFASNSTSSGSASATVDNQTVSTPINVTATNTYTWTPTLGTSWIVPTNWSPARLLPQTNDTLVIDGNTTPAPLLTDIPTQTIAGLHLINSAAATLNASTIGAAKTLTISGATLSDLTVPATNTLTLAGTTGLTINVASGSAATIGGVVLFQDGPHRLVGNAANAITFQSGALCTTVPGTFNGNPFGSGSGAGNGAAGSVIFANGSTYSHNSGDSPFGTAGNGPVVTFQTGSLARWFTSSGFQASGRTYANLQIGAGLLVPVSVSDSGTGTFTFDNLTVRSTSSASSSLTYDGSSGAGSINIQGNITSTGVGAGSLPDVTLTPGSGGTNINKVGGGTIVFSTDGLNTRAVDLEGGATVANGTTLSLARVVLLGLSNPHLNTLTVAATADISGGPNGYVVGSLSRASVPAGSSVFPVGTTGAYSPVDLANASGGGSLSVAARTPQQPVLAPATSLQRYWTLNKTGSLTTDLTFHYLDGDVSGNEANYRVVVVEAGNATSFPADANHSVDTVNNTFTKLAVQSFSDWTVAEPAAPTAVKLTGFAALRSGDEVKLEWQSGYEAHNLGYNIYREQGGQRVPITPSLVAGSALVAGSGTSFTAGLRYVWYDRLGEKAAGSRQTAENGRPSAVDGQRSSPTYWLEDVDLNGTRTLHGPIAVTECAGDDARCKQIGERSRLLRELTNPQSAIRNPKSASGVLFSGWPVWRDATDGGSRSQQKSSNNPTADADDLARQQQLIAARPGVKIRVSRDGWYRVTQSELVAAGLDAGVDASHLQLYANGRAVPIKLSGDGLHLDGSDYLEFYGQGRESTTDAAQTYYLTVADGLGTRIRQPFPESINEPSEPTSFAYTTERKERMIYFSGLRNGDGENFFGQVVSGEQISATLPVSRLETATPAQLEITLQGVSSQNHVVRVLLNGAAVGTMNFANMDHAVQTFEVPGTNVLEGDNTVELVSLNGAADVSLVDVIRLTYAHKYVADDNQLALFVGDQETKRFAGFQSADVRVIDVTSPAQVKELTPSARVTALEDGSFAVDVQIPGATPLRLHKVLVFASGIYATVDSLAPNNASSWWSETAGADYVMITTGELAASVEPLAQLRRNQGMVVQVVDVEDLYDEFSFGEHSPQAIHDFLAGAMTWARQPHYLLLAGDASYDPKNYTGQGANDLVPTRLIDTALMETASDDWLADFNHDGLADISVGRLPTRTAGETSALVTKIVGYENAAPAPARGALLVADTSFEAPSSVVQSLLPLGMTVATVNRSSADDATIHSQIISGLNQGPLVANYIGHGSNGVWTGASLLSNDDAPALANTNRLTVFTMMTCFNGFFQNAYNDSLSEALLKSPGGAVAVWASTTLTEPGGQNLIDQEFYRLLFGPQPLTLGDAARAAKTVTTDADVRRTWTLFGDPALRLR